MNMMPGTLLSTHVPDIPTRWNWFCPSRIDSPLQRKKKKFLLASFLWLDVGFMLPPITLGPAVVAA